MESLLERIDKSYSSFSAGHRKVARYLYYNLKEALLLDSAQIAKKCLVSESTVSRFITNLGYSGIKDFKQDIGKLVLKEYSPSSRLNDSNRQLQGSNSILENVLTEEANNLNSLHTNISATVFDEAVETLCSAKTVYIAGLRSNYALALYANFHFRYFLHNVVLLQTDCGDVPDQLYKCGKDDVLLIISFRRHPRLAITITERAKAKGAAIIAITNHHLSPVGKLADIPLIAKTQLQSYIESPTASMALLNTLITAVSEKNKDASTTSLNSLKVELDEFEIYAE